MFLVLAVHLGFVLVALPLECLLESAKPGLDQAQRVLAAATR